MNSRAIRLSYLLELLISFGVGLGFSRYGWDLLVAERSVMRRPARAPEIAELVREFLLGFAVAQGLGVLLERVRRHHRGCWGEGRQTWVFVCLSALLLMALSLSILRAPAGWSGDSNRLAVELRWIAPLLLALVPVFWLTQRLAGPPRDTAPDEREWAGRIFLVIVSYGVLLTLIVR